MAILKNMTPAIELEHLSRRYGRQFIFSDVNLVVNPAKTIVLKGNNGAGKTTFLKVLSTRLRPSSGKGKIFGYDLKSQSGEIRKLTAYLSVLGGNYQNLSALENLRFALKLSKVDFSPELILDRLEHVGLIDVRNKMVREFSSGMKKRLSIAKLMSVDAKLWLLDEPFAALDSEGKNLVDDLILRAKEEQRTVIIASHDVERSSQFADTILSIEDASLKLEKSLNNG